MSETTAHLALPFIMAAQAQKHVTHNEALRLLDGLVQMSVKDRDLTPPPATPNDGDRYIVASGATGGWAGSDLNFALWVDGAWLRLPPHAGWRAWVEDEGILLVFTGTNWIGTTPAALLNLALLGLGTTADTANPFSAKLNAALWTAKTIAEGGTGDLFYTMNKEAAGDDHGLILQTAYVTKALVDLFGTDKFRLAVSADGLSFFDGLIVDNAKGIVDQPRRDRNPGVMRRDLGRSCLRGDRALAADNGAAQRGRYRRVAGRVPRCGWVFRRRVYELLGCEGRLTQRPKNRQQAKHAAGEALRHLELLPNVLDASTATSGA